MENGVSVTDVGTLAGLRAVGGYGYGNFAGDGSAVKESVRGNRDIALIESVNQGTRDQFLSSQIRQHNDSVSDRISSAQNFLSAQVSDQSSEFRFANITAQFASLERSMIANQQNLVAALHAQDLKYAECCCELKAGQAAILAEIKCNREVAEARQAGMNEAKLDILLNSGRGQGNS